MTEVLSEQIDWVEQQILNKQTNNYENWMEKEDEMGKEKSLLHIY